MINQSVQELFDEIFNTPPVGERMTDALIESARLEAKSEELIQAHLDLSASIPDPT